MQDIAGRNGGATELDRVRAHLHQAYAPGDLLAPLNVIAALLGLPHNSVRRAVRQLDTLGELAICRPRTRIVLARDEVHPHDRDLVAVVGARIRAGRYRPGHALPTGLLGEEFSLRPEHVRRACAHMVAAGLLVQDDAGPYGPAYYVR
ncbi:hypothetical protein LG634_07025 [Streptomyces bambusae]|uniref:hypothetical protein n=1 Tax=Streptomyces bambusae TaxID=1550616 RepID=UPI001CFD9D83|nr:hypothetical protein [Streptomyces bambusae]MCB5164586.1 hypothetical protein [Streptomyces bambusae]